jgi:SPASM domain peptide maturase of grasp-with-spasm system
MKILPSNCLLTKGASHFTIVDMQLDAIYRYANYYLKNLKCTANGIIQVIGPHNKFIEHLLQNNLIISIDSSLNKNFVPLQLQWDYPAQISNAVVQIPGEQGLFINICTQLKELQCNNVLLVFTKQLMALNTIKQYMHIIEQQEFSCVDLIFDFTNETLHQYLIEVVQANLVFRSIITYNANSTSLVRQLEYGAGSIIQKVGAFTFTSCGLVHKDQFVDNILHFTEALEHNTCLNRKIAIDGNGEIRNCPNMPKGFGNIKETELKEVITKPDFQKLWHIKKDDVKKCQECEFRYICTDCRAYIDDPHDVYSAPLKCGYEPHTGEWQQWSTNPLKQKSIEYYNLENAKTN